VTTIVSAARSWLRRLGAAGATDNVERDLSARRHEEAAVRLLAHRVHAPRAGKRAATAA
jgi:hypothetical protein